MPDGISLPRPMGTRELEFAHDGPIPPQAWRAAEEEDHRQDELRREIAFAAERGEGMTLTPTEVARLHDVLTWGQPRRSL